MARRDEREACKECALSVGRHTALGNGESEPEQLAAEIACRLVNDGDEAQPDPSILGPRVTTNYHCQSCSMEWRVVRTQGFAPLVSYDWPVDPPKTTPQ